jgi:predicted RNA-binding protein
MGVEMDDIVDEILTMEISKIEQILDVLNEKRVFKGEITRLLQAVTSGTPMAPKRTAVVRKLSRLPTKIRTWLFFMSLLVCTGYALLYYMFDTTVFTDYWIQIILTILIASAISFPMFYFKK